MSFLLSPSSIRLVLVSGLVVSLLFILLFFDELIAKPKFEELCRANQIRPADISNARLRTIEMRDETRLSVEGTPLIRGTDVVFVDAQSREILFRHKSYYARGGWLVYWLSMGSSGPALFRSDCGDLTAALEAICASGNCKTVPLVR